MTAYLYLVGEGYMAFECEDLFLKFLVPKRLTALNNIKTYDDGYIVLETNYGEEYVDLKAIAGEIGLNVDFCGFAPTLKEYAA